MESLFFTNPILLSFGIVALFCAITPLFVPDKKIAAAIAVGGAAVSVFCVTYALLLGASLYEALAFILMLAAISVLTFLPRGKAEKSELPPESGKEGTGENAVVQAEETHPEDIVPDADIHVAECAADETNGTAESGGGDSAEEDRAELADPDAETEQNEAETNGRDGR